MTTTPENADANTKLLRLLSIVGEAEAKVAREAA